MKISSPQSKMKSNISSTKKKELNLNQEKQQSKAEENLKEAEQILKNVNDELVNRKHWI